MAILDQFVLMSFALQGNDLNYVVFRGDRRLTV